jgi:trigger factor
VHVEVEKTGPCEARVAFKVPAQEFQRRFQERLNAVGRQAKLKGFRPGKVPAHVVAKLFGTEVERETLEACVQEAYETAVQQESLRPAAHPRVSITELAAPKEKDLEHAFELPLKPEVTLGQFEGLSVQRREVSVDDPEVEATIKDILRQQATPEPAGEEGLVEDGLALARIELVHGGEVVAARDGLRIGLATTPNGVEAKTYQDAVRDQENLRGKEGVCRVHLNEVFRLTIPPEDNLYKVFRVDDAAGLRAIVKEQLLQAKKNQEDQRIEQELFDRVLDAHPMDLPGVLVDAQIESRVAAARGQLTEQGVPPEDIERQIEADRDGTREASERSLRALYLVEAIADRANLRVFQEDMVGELSRIAQRNRVSLDEVRKYYAENNLFQQLAVELLERKVKRHLRERAA